MMCVRPLDGTFACDHVRTRSPSPSSSMFTPGVESELVPRSCLELVWFEHTNKKASVLIFDPDLNVAADHDLLMGFLLI